MFIALLEEITADDADVPLLVGDLRLSGQPVVWCSNGLEALEGAPAQLAVGCPLAPMSDVAEQRALTLRQATGPIEVELFLEPLADRAGRFPLCVGLVRTSGGDVAAFERARAKLLTKLSAACDALAAARQADGHQAEQVLRSVTTAVLASNAAERIVYANAAALGFLQRRQRDTLGKSVTAVLGERIAEAARRPGPLEERSDQRLYTATGIPLDGGVNLIRVRPPDAAAFNTLFLIRDLGERRQAELELLRLRGLEALDQMAAGFAHEVRNPLAALKTMAESLVLEFQPGDGRVEFATRIVSSVARIEKLVEHSLRLARPRPWVPRPVAVEDLVQRALSALAPRYAGRAGDVAVVCEASHWRVSCDVGQVAELLCYLVENAFDATAADGAAVSIEVSLQSTLAWAGLWTRIDVKDRGVGISEQNAERLFQPFFTTKAKSLGLSLAIAQRLARDNRGHLVADSEPGVGTVFSLFLPSDHPPAGPRSPLPGPLRTSG